MWKCNKCGSMNTENTCSLCNSPMPDGGDNLVAGGFGNIEDEQTSAVVYQTYPEQNFGTEAVEGNAVNTYTNNNAAGAYQAPQQQYYAQQQYNEQQYVEQQYADQQYVGQQYADQQYVDQQYVDQQYVDQQYGEQQYTEQQYQTDQYNAQQYENYGYGQDYNDYQEPYGNGEYMPQPPQKKSGNTALIIVCIILSVLLVGAVAFGAYYFMTEKNHSSKKKGSDDESIETVASEEDEEKEKSKDESKSKNKKDGKSDKDYNEIDTEIIEQIISNNSDYTEFNIYVKNLRNGYEFHYNDKASVLASALGQIVILDTISDMEKRGVVSCDYDEIFFEYTPNGKYAPWSPQQHETYLSVISCIEDVAAYGDNNKSNALIDFIGEVEGRNGLDVINDRLEDLGYNRTRIIRKTNTQETINDPNKLNHTSAYEIGRIFENFILDSSFGTKNRTISMFKCLNINDEPIGLMDYIGKKYISGNINAFSNQTTNNVAYISDGKNDIIVVILSNTDADKIKIENNDSRDAVQRLLIDEIVKSQLK